MNVTLLLLLATLALSPVAADAAERTTAAHGAAGASANAPAQKLDVNRASAEELLAVPGIGPRMAQAILDLRTKKGSLKRIEDLLEVAGIKEKKLALLTAYLEVLPQQAATLNGPAAQQR
jgi:competence protein ComEA